MLSTDARAFLQDLFRGILEATTDAELLKALDTLYASRDFVTAESRF